MKGDLSDPRGFLHSWKATDLGGACSGAWTGIKCVNGNVATITLPWHGLAGTLSAPWLGQLTRLRRLSLHDNAIVGAFPSSLGFLPDLHGLYLFNNRFSGTVPPEIDCCLMLQSFDASTSLAQKFGHTSFAGNILLCGYFASSPPCPVSTSPAPASTSQGTTGCHGLRKFSSKELVLIIAGIVIGVLILLSLCCLLLCLLTRKKKSSTGTKAQSGKQLSSKDATGAGAAAAAGQGEKLGASKAESGGNVGVKLVHFNGPLVFTADDLLCTTAEIMGKSTYDTVYKATLEDGSLLAVKRLREKITKGQKEFEAEAAALGKVRHPNLLSLRAYNLGPKGEKLLVIDYIPKGSLSAFLHNEIASFKIVHPLKLDPALCPKITDISLSCLMTAAVNSSVLAAASALGYRAPELSKLKKASGKTNVFSLGIIILELLTGKSPANTTYHSGWGPS
uniref:Protein kinase domain-containing protein n=1 Tax=Triticum aestivum TaxID=4565 RepID=A0A077S4S2_WHEAT|nr:unnamed protein product [Triticum aestivum]